MRTPAALLALLTVVACAPLGGARPPRETASVPTLYDTQRQIAEYIDSGRYEADVARVVDGAIVWLEERADQVTRPAIVLDIDETSLSNWRGYRLNGWARILAGPCDLERGPCGIRAWQAMHLATAIVPTRRLVARARELGVAVFFITGRPAQFQGETETNLREQGYTWDGLFLLPQNFGHMTSAADFKAPARRRIVEEGYTIVLNMGDQESDLAGGFAERGFKLPNPVYFLP